MRRIPLITLLLCSAALSAQNLPVLLIQTDARQAALCCPGEAAKADFATLRAGAGYGIWSAAAGSTLLSADAEYKLPMGLDLGISAVMMRDSEYETANVRGMFSGTYTPQEMAFGLTAGYRFSETLKAGIRGRYIYSSLARSATATAFGGDVYCVYDSRILTASLELCNLGTAINYGYGSYAQPSLVRAGATVRPLNGLLLAADADYLFTGALMAGIGAEYTILDVVSLRAGYHYGDAAKAIPSYATTGAGVTFKGVTLDAVFFLATQKIAGTMMFRLGYAF